MNEMEMQILDDKYRLYIYSLDFLQIFFTFIKILDYHIYLL